MLTAVTITRICTAAVTCANAGFCVPRARTGLTACVSAARCRVGSSPTLARICCIPEGRRGVFLDLEGAWWSARGVIRPPLRWSHPRLAAGSAISITRFCRRYITRNKSEPAIDPLPMGHSANNSPGTFGLIPHSHFFSELYPALHRSALLRFALCIPSPAGSQHGVLYPFLSNSRLTPLTELMMECRCLIITCTQYWLKQILTMVAHGIRLTSMTFRPYISGQRLRAPKKTNLLILRSLLKA